MKWLKTILIALVITAPSLVHAAQADDSSEKQVSFKGAGGTNIDGTLVIPARAPDQRFPAILLLAGSGPTDRDGNQRPVLVTDLLSQIAGELAAHGIASLRYDKRGMNANESELPKDPKQYDDFFAWENFVGDACAACQFLRDQPRIDAAHVGILGHSEGGLLALEAARALGAQSKSPAVLILLATPGRPIDLVIADQLSQLLAKQGASQKQTDFFLHENARIAAQIRLTAKVPSDVPRGMEAIYPQYLGKFLHGELAVDPCKLAREFPGPVLISIGLVDTQVSPTLDAKALEAAMTLRRKNDCRLVIIPRASHNMKIVKNENDPGFAGSVSSEFLDELDTFTQDKLLAVDQGPATKPEK